MSGTCKGRDLEINGRMFETCHLLTNMGCSKDCDSMTYSWADNKKM